MQHLIHVVTHNLGRERGKFPGPALHLHCDQHVGHGVNTCPCLWPLPVFSSPAVADWGFHVGASMWALELGDGVSMWALPLPFLLLQSGAREGEMVIPVS